MKEKYCNGCKEILDISLFQKESRAKNGYKPRCKNCLNSYYRKQYKNFRKKKIESAQEYYKNNKEKVLKRSKVYAKKNKEKIRKQQREYNIKNKDVLNKKKLEYHKNKIKNDLEYRLNINIKKMISRLRDTKNVNTSSKLNFTKEEFIEKVGIPKENEQIDHKIPVSWFKLNTPIGIINNIDNLQILSKEENCKKGNRTACPVSLEFYNKAKIHVKNKYINSLKIIEY